jgi:transposase
MLKIRIIKTGSKNKAVQIVRRKNHTTEIVKHIGTAKNNDELIQLHQLADKYICKRSNAISLFPNLNDNSIKIENLQFTQSFHSFAYEFLSYFYELNGFNKLKNKLLKDLSIIRLIEPASKIRSIELIQEYFGIKYSRNTMYRNLNIFSEMKLNIEKIAIEYAKTHLNFDFSLVFYDVTTLYFESFKDDELRKCGFSKDNKFNQPQILIALIVNKDGYPISINIFEGNKFEGHTFIPTIKELKNKHNIKNLTVVADAGMLSFDNIKKLENENLNYIVGARLSSLSKELLKNVSTKLNKTEKKYFKTKTDHGILICDYLKKRATKDKNDRKKQILRAQNQINNPSKSIKKLRFVKELTKSKYIINQELIEKAELLDGIKGYYTNLDNLSEDLIISRYKDLWNIEKAFRIAKSDLMARPIFHYKKIRIEAHILLIFVSLCVSKSIELLTGLSIKKIIHQIFKILDIELIDQLTGKKFIKRMDTKNNDVFQVFEKLKKSLEY